MPNLPKPRLRRTARTRGGVVTRPSEPERPKVDEYDDYLFVVLHFPAYDKSVGRLNAAEVDVFVGPDYVVTLPNEPVQPLEYLFERARSREDFREIVRPQRAARADLEHTKRYIPEGLDSDFDDINDASERIWDMLENFKE